MRFLLIENAKASHDSKLVREFTFSKNHKIYKYIKSVLKGDSFPPYSYTSAYLDPDKATLFKDYFHSVFSTSIYLQRIQFLHLTPFSAISQLLTWMFTRLWYHLTPPNPLVMISLDQIFLNVEPCPYIVQFIICLPCACPNTPFLWNWRFTK